eukprot:5478319-Pyramimonas_sp.AAC.1
MQPQRCLTAKVAHLDCFVPWPVAPLRSAFAIVVVLSAPDNDYGVAKREGRVKVSCAIHHPVYCVTVVRAYALSTQAHLSKCGRRARITPGVRRDTDNLPCFPHRSRSGRGRLLFDIVHTSSLLSTGEFSFRVLATAQSGYPADYGALGYRIRLPRVGLPLKSVERRQIGTVSDTQFESTLLSCTRHACINGSVSRWVMSLRSPRARWLAEWSRMWRASSFRAKTETTSQPLLFYAKSCPS